MVVDSRLLGLPELVGSTHLGEVVVVVSRRSGSSLLVGSTSLVGIIVAASRRPHMADKERIVVPVAGPHMASKERVVVATVRPHLVGTCNVLESKRLRSTRHAERTTPTTIPLTLLFSLRVKGLTRE